MDTILTSKPNTTVMIRGVEIPINWDFRTSITFTEILGEKSLSKKDVIIKGLRLYYGDWADNHLFEEGEIEEAVERMLEFYAHKQENTGSGKGKQCKKPNYSFTYDAEYIYAAFLEQYKIDLSTQDMHWWQFKALFNGLNNSTQFGKIIGYRAMELSGLSDVEKKFYREMKSLYKLPNAESALDDKLADEIAEALENGGDIDAILSKKYD